MSVSLGVTFVARFAEVIFSKESKKRSDDIEMISILQEANCLTV